MGRDGDGVGHQHTVQYGQEWKAWFAAVTPVLSSTEMGPNRPETACRVAMAERWRRETMKGEHVNDSNMNEPVHTRASVASGITKSTVPLALRKLRASGGSGLSPVLCAHNLHSCRLFKRSTHHVVSLW